MPKVSAKSAVGRQSQLPFKRAVQISVKSLRMRFWRSIITAGGIFLGIAFLSTVLTQRLMQWPVAEDVDAGFVRISGEVDGPGDYEVWNPVPVQEGIKAGIPRDVIEKVANGKNAFSLTAVVQGKLNARRADKNLARVNKEWIGLRKLQKRVALYVDVKDDKDISVPDAVRVGVPKKIALDLAGDEKTFKGSWLADMIREQPDWISPFFAAVALDQDITLGDAKKVGVPEAIARHLIGDGKSFKGGALNDAIKAHPKWMKIWTSRAKRNAIFKKVDNSSIERLAEPYAITLGQVVKQAKGFGKNAREAEVMIVNADGRKENADFANEKARAAAVKLQSGDTILVPDRNNYYRMIWLVVMSLLVCWVGITNSMLMSVTERFKEIGTMKCLGALDKFVVTLFMLESGMMGIVASVLGWAIGFLLMVVIAGFSRGWDLVATIGLWDVTKTLLWAAGVGLVLTIIATIAPAQRAARMPAAMALRSEI